MIEEKQATGVMAQKAPGPWVTVVVAPDGGDAHLAVQQVEKLLSRETGRSCARHWLVERRVCELRYDGAPPKGFHRMVAGFGADVMSLPEASRKKKLFLSDMDSTIIQQECIDEIADALGLREKVADITERAMRGELVFEDSLRERVALLKGLPEQVLQEIYDTRITLTPGAKRLVRGLRAQGCECVLVSGGFTFFTSRVAERLGFHRHYANELEIENGRLTGRVKEPVFGPSGKLAVLESLVDEMRITLDEVVAVGDGANDVPMLEKAGLGVAFHAKPAVRETVPAQINEGDLSPLCWALGVA